MLAIMIGMVKIKCLVFFRRGMGPKEGGGGGGGGKVDLEIRKTHVYVCTLYQYVI